MSESVSLSLHDSSEEEASPFSLDFLLSGAQGEGEGRAGSTAAIQNLTDQLRVAQDQYSSRLARCAFLRKSLSEAEKKIEDLENQILLTDKSEGPPGKRDSPTSRELLEGVSNPRRLTQVSKLEQALHKEWTKNQKLTHDLESVLDFVMRANLSSASVQRGQVTEEHLLSSSVLAHLNLSSQGLDCQKNVCVRLLRFFKNGVHLSASVIQWKEHPHFNRVNSHKG